jgi:hypothetical protein
VLRYEIVRAFDKESDETENETNNDKRNSAGDMRYFQRQTLSGTRRTGPLTVRVEVLE